MGDSYEDSVCAAPRMDGRIGCARRERQRLERIITLMAFFGCSVAGWMSGTYFAHFEHDSFDVLLGKQGINAYAIPFIPSKSMLDC